VISSARGFRGEALAPELPPDPVADQALAVPVEDQDVARDRPFEEDCLLRDVVARKDLLPVSRERVSVPRREQGHSRCFGISLMLEEDRDVTFGYVAEHAQ